MAVTNNKSKTTLVLVVSGDVKANGEYARKTIRFTTLRTTATGRRVPPHTMRPCFGPARALSRPSKAL